MRLEAGAAGGLPWRRNRLSWTRPASSLQLMVASSLQLGVASSLQLDVASSLQLRFASSL